MNAKDKQVYGLQGLIAGLSLLPIFFLAGWVPTLAPGQAALLDQLLDEYLLGRVGVWSSNFPLMSKAVANYVALVAPLSAVALGVLVCRHQLLPLDRLPVLAWRRQVLAYVGCVALTALFLTQNYFGYTDFAHHRAKFRWVGQHPGLYPFFACMMLFALQFMFVLSYAVLVHYPCKRLARRWAARAG